METLTGYAQYTYDRHPSQWTREVGEAVSGADVVVIHTVRKEEPAFAVLNVDVKARYAGEALAQRREQAKAERRAELMAELEAQAEQREPGATSGSKSKDSQRANRERRNADPVKLAQWRALQREYQRKRRENETEEEREARLAKDRQKWRERREDPVKLEADRSRSRVWKAIRMLDPEYREHIRTRARARRSEYAKCPEWRARQARCSYRYKLRQKMKQAEALIETSPLEAARQAQKVLQELLAARRVGMV